MADKSRSLLPRLWQAIVPRVKPYSEMGVSGTPVYAGYAISAERSSALVGQEKYRTFSEIMTNTSIIAAGMRFFLNIVAKPSWSAVPADDSAQAKEMANFATEVLESLHTPWSRVVRRCGTYRFHGFNVQEWTAIKRDDGRVGLVDVESRPQWTIVRWEVDENGSITGMWQRDPQTGTEMGIPRGKVMYLVDDTVTDSPEGMGLLRHCVEPATRLKEYLAQEATGFLRDLRGIPIGRAPMDDLKNAVDAGQITQAQANSAIDQLRAFVELEKKGKTTGLILNSQPYISMTDSGNNIAATPKWGIELVTGMAPGLADVGAAINRLNQEMARLLGVESMMLGSTSSGSLAMARDKSTNLYLLANSVLRDIKLQAQHDLIEPLWSLNGFDEKLMPELSVQDVAPQDVEQMAAVLRDMATAGAVLAPDDEAINSIRDLLGLPQADLEEAAKMVAQDQAKAQQAEARTQESHDASLAQMEADQGATKRARDEALVAAVDDHELLIKVVGPDAADFIRDFLAGERDPDLIREALVAWHARLN